MSKVYTTRWLRRDATTYIGINDQLIKIHSTHLWITCVLSSSISYFCLMLFSA